MSRTRKLTERFYVSLSAQHSILVSYYAWKYNRDRTELIRDMIYQFGLADSTLDEAELQQFVKKQILPEHKDDNLMTNEVKARLEDILAERGARRGGKGRK